MMAEPAAPVPAAEAETAPLLPASSEPAASAAQPEPPRPNAKRSVTFNPNPVTRTIEPDPRPQPAARRRVPPDAFQSAVSTGNMAAGTPVLASLNSKIRRRSSQGTVPGVGGGGGGGGGGAAGNTGAPAGLLPLPGGAGGPGTPHPLSKIGPQRSSKTAQKLKLLPTTPNPDDGGDEDEESGREVYSQYTRIKDPTARRDAARLGKADRARLPRVTAYCTANRYQMDGLMRFLKGGRGRAKGANPKLIDECIYTPYAYKDHTPTPSERRRSSPRSSASHGPSDGLGIRGVDGAGDAVPEGQQVTSPNRQGAEGEAEPVASPTQLDQGDLIDLAPAQDDIGSSNANHEDTDAHGLGNGNMARQEEAAAAAVAAAVENAAAVVDGSAIDHRPARPADFDIHVHTPEVFLFDYGVVVIWGMSELQEQRFLKEIARFETEKLAPEEVETERFNFYYTSEYQPRIYNDFITLRDKNSYMTKLAISHALAQSVKTSLFEELIASTIDTCKDIPTQIALTGKIALSRTQINMQIGELFILRISIHLNGSVLDTPELFWVEPQLEPVYQAVRSYLEMDQRVGLLTERLDVIADLLAVLKDQLSHGHGEKLEWIVIVLIAAEILVAAVNIVVDLYAGVD